MRDFKEIFPLVDNNYFEFPYDSAFPIEIYDPFKLWLCIENQLEKYNLETNGKFSVH